MIQVAHILSDEDAFQKSARAIALAIRTQLRGKICAAICTSFTNALQAFLSAQPARLLYLMLLQALKSYLAGAHALQSIQQHLNHSIRAAMNAWWMP